MLKNVLLRKMIKKAELNIHLLKKALVIVKFFRCQPEEKPYFF